MNPSTTYYHLKAWRCVFWGIAWLHGFIACAGFTIGNFVDEESRHLTPLTGVPAVLFLVALIVTGREALRCFRIHFSLFSETRP